MSDERPARPRRGGAARPGAAGRAGPLTETNRRLAATLREARDQIVTLKAEVDRLAEPPNGFGVFLGPTTTARWTSTRRGASCGSAVAPGVGPLVPGQEVLVNEAMNIVAALGYERVGEIVMFKELLEDGERALVIGHTDEERVVRLAQALRDQTDPRRRLAAAGLRGPRYVYERIPKSEVEELVLEEMPDVDYRDIGGLSRPDRDDPRRRRAALPALRTCSASTSSPRRRGSCSTGPPAAARR